MIQMKSPSKKPRKYKDPYGSIAWYAQVWSNLFGAKYAMPVEYGAKPARIAKTLFKKVEEIYPDLTPEEIYNQVTYMAEVFLDRKEFNWISLRDIASLNANIYRVEAQLQEESDHGENQILDVLFREERRLLQKDPEQVEGSKEVLAIAGNTGMGEGSGESVQDVRND